VQASVLTLARQRNAIMGSIQVVVNRRVVSGFSPVIILDVPRV
jgi:hypothetical protein